MIIWVLDFIKSLSNFLFLPQRTDISILSIDTLDMIIWILNFIKTFCNFPFTLLFFILRDVSLTIRTLNMIVIFLWIAWDRTTWFAWLWSFQLILGISTLDIIIWILNFPKTFGNFAFYLLWSQIWVLSISTFDVAIGFLDVVKSFCNFFRFLRW